MTMEPSSPLEREVEIHTLRQQNRERRELLRRLLHIQEEERKYVAKELHDDTGQSLTSLIMGLKLTEDLSPDPATQARLKDLRALAQRALEDLHRLSVTLRPTLLDDLGLVAAANSLLKQFGQEQQVQVHFQAQGFGGPEAGGFRLNPLIELVVYRVIQEALVNIGRYAQAQQVWLNFVKEDHTLKVTIRDDGNGFDPAALAEHQQLGILGMQERMAILEGNFQLTSAAGHGTLITVSAPLKEES